MIDEQRRYFSFLLRLWQERATVPPVWRASLENSHTGDLIGFADIVELFAFLEAQVAGESTQRSPHRTERGPVTLEPIDEKEIRK